MKGENHAQRDEAISFMHLVAAGKVREAYDRHVGANFRHHNAFFRGDRESLMRAMEENAARNPDKVLDVKHTLEDGNYVAVHSHVRQNAQDRGGAVRDRRDVVGPVVRADERAVPRAARPRAAGRRAGRDQLRPRADRMDADGTMDRRTSGSRIGHEAQAGGRSAAEGSALREGDVAQGFKEVWMASAKWTVKLSAPADKVFSFLADHPERATMFIPGLNRIDNVRPNEPGVGYPTSRTSGIPVRSDSRRPRGERWSSSMQASGACSADSDVDGVTEGVLRDPADREQSVVTLLHAPDDVWLLHKDELLLMLEGCRVTVDIEARRAALLRHKAMNAPPLLTSEGESLAARPTGDLAELWQEIQDAVAAVIDRTSAMR